MLPQHTLQEEEEDSNTTSIRQQYISSMTRITNEEDSSSNTSSSGSELTSMSMMQTVLSSMMLGSETTHSTNTTTNHEKNDSSSTHSSSTRMLAFPSIGNVFAMEGGEQNQISSAKKQEELANNNNSTTRMMGFVPSISDIFAMEDHGGDGSNDEHHEHTRKTNVPKATGTTTTTTTTDQTEEQRDPTMGLFPSISNLFSMEEDALSIDKDGAGRVERVPPSPRTQQPHPRLRRTLQSNTVELLREAPTATYDDEDEEDTSCDGSHSQNDTTQQIYVRTRPYKVTEHYRESVFYISISAILGSIVRVYMARWFGLDCELNTNDGISSMGGAVQDFFTSWSRTICVTTTGQSLQTGGALFIDFPSNVLGRYVIYN